MCTDEDDVVDDYNRHFDPLFGVDVTDVLTFFPSSF